MIFNYVTLFIVNILAHRQNAMLNVCQTCCLKAKVICNTLNSVALERHIDVTTDNL